MTCHSEEPRDEESAFPLAQVPFTLTQEGSPLLLRLQGAQVYFGDRQQTIFEGASRLRNTRFRFLQWPWLAALFITIPLAVTTESKSPAVLPCRDQPAMQRVLLPPPILQRIEKIAPGAVANTPGCGLSASDYSAWSVKLNNSILAFVAQGRTSCLCEDGNCSLWIFQKTPTGFRDLLDDFGVHDFHFKSTRTMGYPDLVTSAHSAPFDFKLNVFRFDGTRYELRECWDRSFANWNKYGKVIHVSKHGKVTREGCPQL